MKHRPHKPQPGDMARADRANAFAGQTTVTREARERQAIHKALTSSPATTTIPMAIDAYVATGMSRQQAVNVVARICETEMAKRRAKPSLFKAEDPVDLVHVPMGWTHTDEPTNNS